MKVQRPMRSAPWLATLLVAIGCAIGSTPADVWPPRLLPFPLLLGLFLVVGFAATAARFFADAPLTIPRRGRVDGAVLDARGRCIVQAQELLGADVTTHDGAYLVSLYDRRLRLYYLRTSSLEEAETAIAQLGLPSTRLLRVMGKSMLPSAALAIGVAGGIIALVFALKMTFTQGPTYLPLAVIALIVALRSIPVRIVVGVDGVHSRWLFWQQFIAMKSIQNVTWLRGGATVHMADTDMFFPMDPTVATRFVQRVHECVTQHRLDVFENGSTATEIEPRLERGDRPIAKWVADLRKLLIERSYREAATSPALLARTIEDADRAPIDRAAAAIALAASGEDARVRIRVVAGTTADPDLRDVLHAIASDEALDAALLERLDPTTRR